MEKNKVKLSGLEESERIKEIKEMYGDTESFLMKANPKTQVDFCDLRMAVSCDCPTIDDLCRKNYCIKLALHPAYGLNAICELQQPPKSRL